MNRDSLTGQAIAQSHYVFIARVDRATGTAGRPLAYFRGRKGGLKFPPPPPQATPAMAS
jgi:hypothetical protein